MFLKTQHPPRFRRHIIQSQGHKRLKILALLVFLLSWFLTLPGHANTYPQQTVSMYMTVCQQSCLQTVNSNKQFSVEPYKSLLGTWVKTVCHDGCQCQIDGFQKQLPFDAFSSYDKALGNKTAEKHPNHAQIQQIMESCSETAIQKNPPPKPAVKSKSVSLSY